MRVLNHTCVRCGASPLFSEHCPYCAPNECYREPFRGGQGRSAKDIEDTGTGMVASVIGSIVTAIIFLFIAAT